MPDMAKKPTIPIRSIGGGSDDLAETPAKLSAIRAVLREEYEKRHRQPWIVAYSGGKDSTLLLQLVFEAMLSVPPEKRRRQVHVIANDTQVESPLVINHLYESVDAIRKFSCANGLPVSVKITKPYADQTFWVNVIGRGYIPPTRNFRWCTDRLKIQPTSEFIVQQTRIRKAVLLIGTRKAESSSRKRRMENYARQSRGRMNPHGQIKDCRVFSPIAELSDNEVWAVLLQTRPPWGGTHRRLITLYRNAGGGDCPLVLSKEDAPSCGTTSPRFGCWTCTVIAKDRSLGGLIDSGYEELEALQNFRERLVELREDENNRMPMRRNGSSKYREDGSRVRGPFIMKIRRQIRSELGELEKETGKKILSLIEEKVIDEIWRVDEEQYACRNALLKMVGVPAIA
ncbi:MAG: DNA phosphorothioation system sulfurtransferase DndC [Gammaproteobacteria bacterium]